MQNPSIQHLYYQFLFHKNRYLLDRFCYIQVLTNSDNQALYQQNPSNLGLDDMKTVLTNATQSNLDQKVCDLEKQLNSEKENYGRMIKQCDILKGEKGVLTEEVRLSTRISLLRINT